MFWESFKISAVAIAQIFILGALGFFLVKRRILGEECLGTLSELVVKVTLPLLIFSELVREFRFDLYPHWWIFPLASIAVTAAGLLVALPFTFLFKKRPEKMQFLGLASFQNSGYLPLAIIPAIASGERASELYTYLFLFLLGFNLLVWSGGVHLLSAQAGRRFELKNLFSPPVVACMAGLGVVFFGLQRFIPQVVLRPLGMVGVCTAPLALFVVGASLATISLKHINLKVMGFLVLTKLILLPAAGLWLIFKLGLPEVMGLLFIMQLALPSATSLSVIVRRYKKEDVLISQGIFVSHILSLVSLPIFLSIYLSGFMLR